ncbi:MAG: divergent polysaccharide deacetylase family protein [Deltaproteobacteria bacterium]|nr:divergent polysaccharide deacetylase family protein [Deltaproteobacteria bacterium]
MQRREFLIKSASFLMGSLFGFGAWSRALAFSSSPRQDASPARPRLSLIIDDIGFSRCRAAAFLDLGVPITFAVLPRLAHSRDLALEIHRRGHEIMLHQPMEPTNGEIDPGPGALYVGDRPEKIMRTMEENISEIPFASGVNNHMGSRFTACEREINQALEVVRDRGLFFVDSLTSSRSMAYRTARRLDMPAARRNVFLDNLPEEAAVLRQLRKLRSYTLRSGEGIGIGHPFPETAGALARFLAEGRTRDLELVHISAVIRPA